MCGCYVRSHSREAADNPFHGAADQPTDHQMADWAAGRTHAQPPAPACEPSRNLLPNGDLPFRPVPCRASQGKQLSNGAG